MCPPHFSTLTFPSPVSFSPLCVSSLFARLVLLWHANPEPPPPPCCHHVPLFLFTLFCLTALLQFSASPSTHPPLQTLCLLFVDLSSVSHAPSPLVSPPSHPTLPSLLSAAVGWTSLARFCRSSPTLLSLCCVNPTPLLLGSLEEHPLR